MVKAMYKRTVETKLICPQCGNIQTMFRLASKTKSFGHLKMLWCFRCKKRINHFELRDETIGD
jgi:ribosomal protein S27E